jgi:hypothetical protein
MLVDYEAVLLDLKAVLAQKKSHGGDALLLEIARLEQQHRSVEGLPEKALRLYGPELADALPSAHRPVSGAADGDNESEALDAEGHRSQEKHRAQHAVPLGVA